MPLVGILWTIPLREIVMSKPIAVLLSDVHYNMANLEIADKATRLAIKQANKLKVPLVVCGDLHDTKANLRGECVNALLITFKLCNQKPYILIGNHDRINEKASAHALKFLEPVAQIIDEGPLWIKQFNAYFIPYHHNKFQLQKSIEQLPKNSTLIMHQGLKDSVSGEYIQDGSALEQEIVKDYRVISGHYHQRQTIGTWDYVGNPYTSTFAESEDPAKGIQLLMDDHTLKFIPLNLRKHVVIRMTQKKDCLSSDSSIPDIIAQDIVRVKVKGDKNLLQTITKEEIAAFLGIEQAFKLDLISETVQTTISIAVSKLSKEDALDTFIDAKFDQKEGTKLKKLWRDLSVFTTKG